MKTKTSHPPAENIRAAVDELKKWVLHQFRSFKEEVVGGLSRGEKSQNDGYENDNQETGERRWMNEKENEYHNGKADDRTRSCVPQVYVSKKGEISVRGGETFRPTARSTKVRPEGDTYSTPKAIPYRQQGVYEGRLSRGMRKNGRWMKPSTTLMWILLSVNVRVPTM